MAKNKTVFFCKECGYESPKWLGKCPGCEAWNSLVEEKISETTSAGGYNMPSSKLVKLNEVEVNVATRVDTGFEELNRVLGGGIVEGSLILVGGEPGIGKSTLILQVCNNLAKYGDVLYVSGEESDTQVKIRADRLNINQNNLYFLGETNITTIEERACQMKPKVCVIDSIQTMYDPDISSVPGSISQVREVTARMLNIAKRMKIITIVIGHVTKDGNIAGPRLLEHMVDTVLYMEGERYFSHRIIRGVKNRFGSTNEIGVFEMQQLGLIEVTNMSEMFLIKESNLPGTCTTALLEGSSVMLLEVQALTSHSYYTMPRRVATGVDINRLFMILAVIEKICNMNIGSQDVYINVVGGLKLNETATDFAIAMAIISSYKSQVLENSVIYIGELSLTGEIRSVINIEKRLKEAEKLGYSKAYVPKSQTKNLKYDGKMDIVAINNIKEMSKND